MSVQSPAQCESCRERPAATTARLNDGKPCKLCWLCFKPANLLALTMAKAVTS